MRNGQLLLFSKGERPRRWFPSAYCIAIVLPSEENAFDAHGFRLIANGNTAHPDYQRTLCVTASAARCSYWPGITSSDHRPRRALPSGLRCRRLL